MKLLIFLTARKLKVSPPRVFGLAFEYAEDFHKKDFMLRVYYNWVNKDIIHPVVLDYCLDVLSNRT